MGEPPKSHTHRLGQHKDQSSHNRRLPEDQHRVFVGLQLVLGNPGRTSKPKRWHPELRGVIRPILVADKDPTFQCGGVGLLHAPAHMFFHLRDQAGRHDLVGSGVLLPRLLTAGEVFCKQPPLMAGDAWPSECKPSEKMRKTPDNEQHTTEVVQGKRERQERSIV